jgi:hypothetical protein
MVSSVTKGSTSIIKVGQQLWKAYKPIMATFKGTKGTIEPQMVVIPNPSLSHLLTFYIFFFLHYIWSNFQT